MADSARVHHSSPARAKYLGASQSGTRPLDPAPSAGVISLATERAIRAARASALDAAMTACGWTEGKLARVLDVSPSLVGRYRRGETGFSDAIVDRMGSLAISVRRFMAETWTGAPPAR